MARSSPIIGQTIGSYEVKAIIGAGGMGEVFLAVHPDIGSRVAIKVLSKDSLRAPGLVERFFIEAKAVNAIRHENIVNILDQGRLDDGRPYIIMEHLDGASLSEVVKLRGPLPLGSLARLACQVLDALGAAHNAGIVHRDLKPDNIFITPNGRAKVLDFGTAKLMPNIDITKVDTESGHVLGTPHYMAPEQIRPDRPIDHRIDIYSVGALLYQCATGRKPFDAPSIYDLLQLQINAMPPPAQSFRPTIPPAYEEVIMTALAKDPDQRYPSAHAMGEALNRAVEGLPPYEWESLSQNPHQHITLAPGSRSAPHAVPQPMRGQSTGGIAAPAQARKHVALVALIVVLVAILASAITAVVMTGGDSADPATDTPGAATEAPGNAAPGNADPENPGEP